MVRPKAFLLALCFPALLMVGCGTESHSGFAAELKQVCTEAKAEATEMVQSNLAELQKTHDITNMTRPEAKLYETWATKLDQLEPAPQDQAAFDRLRAATNHLNDMQAKVDTATNSRNREQRAALNADSERQQGIQRSALNELGVNDCAK